MNPRPIKVTGAVLCALLLFHLLGSRLTKGLWLNVTHSVPAGLYRLEKFDGKAVRGEMVVMKVPAPFRSYVYGRKWLPEGWSLIKHIGAVPGDVFCITRSALAVNGSYVAPVYARDSAGLPLPYRPGCYRVAEDHFLPVATGVSNSWDGRYMGAVHVSEIIGIARPLWTF